MSLCKKFIIVFLLFSCVINAQEMTKKEKRAKHKQIRLFLKQSIALYENHELDSAHILIDSLLKIDAKNPDGYYYKGLIELKKTDTAKADSTLTYGNTIAPLSTRIKLLLSRIKLAQQEYKTAAKLLDTILRIKPHEPETLYLRGITYLNQNDTTKALEYLRNGLKTALDKGN